MTAQVNTKEIKKVLQFILCCLGDEAMTADDYEDELGRRAMLREKRIRNRRGKKPSRHGRIPTNREYRRQEAAKIRQLVQEYAS